MSIVTWPLRLVGLAIWFAKEIVVSNVAVLRDTLTPGQDSTPGVARFETRCRTDGELTLLAAMITLTPGTLALGAAHIDRSGPRTIYVHGMYAASADELRSELTTMEDRMLRAVRRRGIDG